MAALKNRNYKKRVAQKTKSKKRRAYKRLRSVAFGPTYLTKMYYSEYNVLLAVSSSSAATVIHRSHNGPAKPNSAITDQPRYWDTLCGAVDGTAPYRSCYCYGSKITATFTTTNGAPSNVWIGARADGDTAPSDVKIASEKGYTVKSLGYYAGANSNRTISKYVPTHKIFGVPKGTIMGDYDYANTYSAVPVNETLWDIGVEPVASTTSNYYVSIKITYYCKFADKQNVVDS